MKNFFFIVPCHIFDFNFVVVGHHGSIFVGSWKENGLDKIEFMSEFDLHDQIL